MSENGGRAHGRVADAVAARRRGDVVAGLRSLARPAGRSSARENSDGSSTRPPDTERCDLCGVSIPTDHRHLLHLFERRIVCSCEACWALRAGEGDYRPTGNRTTWLPDLRIPDELWAAFQIPIGLAFFMRSTVTECVVALYPSPAGATESELHFEPWRQLVELNPVLRDLEPDVEGLIVNRLSEPPAYAIAPIDRCYALTGVVKATWEGISGGTGVERAVSTFFEDLSRQATKVASA